MATIDEQLLTLDSSRDGLEGEKKIIGENRSVFGYRDMASTLALVLMVAWLTDADTDGAVTRTMWPARVNLV